MNKSMNIVQEMKKKRKKSHRDRSENNSRGYNACLFHLLSLSVCMYVQMPFFLPLPLHLCIPVYV